MTERERWIVYPLLFLALGAALRDKLSEHTKTRTLECQELIVYGEGSASQPPVPLVQIGAVKRTSAESPHLGQILVNGVVQSQAVQAEGMHAGTIMASNVNADNYYFRRVPFAPTPMRAIPGASLNNWLRSQQQQSTQSQAAAADAAASDDSTNAASPAPSSEGDKSAPAK